MLRHQVLSKILYSVLLAWVLSSGLPFSVFAVIPLSLKQHIEREQTNLAKIQSLHFNQAQINLTLERYLDHLVAQVPSNLSSELNRNEILELLKQKISIAVKEEDCLTQTIPLPISTTINSLQSIFKTFVSSHSPHEQLVNIHFENIEVPLVFKNIYGNKLQMNIHGILKDSRSENAFGMDLSSECLTLVVNKNSTDLKIEYLNSADVACPIPREKSGTFLLIISEEIAKQLKMESLSVNDVSKIFCEKSKTYVSLARLKAFQSGSTWYGSQGFGPEGDNPKRLQTYPLTTLLSQLESYPKADLEAIKKAELNKWQYKKGEEDQKKEDEANVDEEISNFLNLKELFKEKLIEFKKTHSSPSDQTMGSFFTWLWETDCQIYSQCDTLIFSNLITRNLANKLRLETKLTKRLMQIAP